MATTGAGNPYVESSDLVANYPAVSETLAERLDVIGVNPFASAAARSSAIPSPTEGMMSSLNDDDLVYRYNGSAWIPVGDPGLKIMAPTSIANSGGSASASGGAVTFTGVTSVSLNGVFTSAYDNYRIMFQDNALTGSGNATLRLRASGSDASGSDYFKVGIYASDANTPTRTLATASTSWMVFGLDAGNASDHPFIMDILFPQLTRRTRFAYQAIGSYSTNNFGYFETSMGSHNQAIEYDGFSLLFPSSITGTVRVYGYKNS